MNLSSPETVKSLLLKYKTRPSKRMGQNFLINSATLNKVLEAAELNKEDIVLEIGAGLGNLTEELAKRVKMVIAVEKDKAMVDILKETLKDYKNIKIIHGDALKFDHKKYDLRAEGYKIVANIPYYLTSPIIRKFLESENKPSLMVLMVQKEVAQRICPKPPKMSLLAVSVQFYAKAEIVDYVPKKYFWPSPEIDSAIIKITPFGILTASTNKKVDVDLFFKIVRAGFSQPRKQLVNNLSTIKSLNGVGLDKNLVAKWILKNGLSPKQRAETLSVDDWIKVTECF